MGTIWVTKLEEDRALEDFVFELTDNINKQEKEQDRISKITGRRFYF